MKNWKVNYPKYAAAEVVDGEKLIAVCDSGDLSINENQENARLIAAAPDMLALLEWTNVMLEENPEAISSKNLYGDRLKEVIKKAEGQ